MKIVSSAKVAFPIVLELAMSRFVKLFLADQSGATAIEYALMTSLLAVVLVAALTNLGTRLSSEFLEVSGALK